MLNFKEMSSVNTSFSVKYNETLKALLCTLYESSYTALGESRGKYSMRKYSTLASLMLYLPQDSHQELYTFIQSGSALSVLLYFTLKDVLTEDIPLKFNTFIE